QARGVLWDLAGHHGQRLWICPGARAPDLAGVAGTASRGARARTLPVTWTREQREQQRAQTRHSPATHRARGGLTVTQIIIAKQKQTRTGRLAVFPTVRSREFQVLGFSIQLRALVLALSVLVG
ncbi:hypothetical protein EGW08_001850, partial [Elysia chlorotica]